MRPTWTGARTMISVRLNAGQRAGTRRGIAPPPWVGAEFAARISTWAFRPRVGRAPRGERMAVAFDEMNGSDGALRPAYGELARWLNEVPPDVLDYRRREAELLFRRIGITFSVYGEADAQERLIPFDVLPRILA